jgi:hypothetical protein
MLQTLRRLKDDLEAKTEREDQAYIAMLALGPGTHPIGVIERKWRELFPGVCQAWDQAADPQATCRDTINSHQNVFRKVDGGWILRSEEASEAYVEGFKARPSNVQ